MVIVKNIIRGIFGMSLLASNFVYGEERQSMDEKGLLQAINQYAEAVESENNLISFKYKGVAVYCIWDAKADRMRMISPIARAADVPQAMLVEALKANYHTVLDARYAIGDDIVYAAFIHPLSPLTTAEIESAIRQVAIASATFGDQFTSGELVFPGEQAAAVEKDDSTI